MHDTRERQLQALLVGVPLPGVSDAENEESLQELRRLVTTLGYRVVGSLSQRRRSLSGAGVLGEGRLQELARLTGGSGSLQRPSRARKSKAALRFAEADVAGEEEDEPEQEPLAIESDEPVDCVVFDCDLSPSQLANLQRATGVQVLDRTGVIVQIFSRHARTREARLQVEIARLSYLSPRLRVAGGAGTGNRMGLEGESTLELDRRRIRDRIAELRRELDGIQREQSVGRRQRSEQNCVALVGYTNAGKSSLMRALTGSQVLVEDKLFATLDTTVRTLAPPTIPPMLISDTVGFIRKLPHDLVASFRSTLEEANSAGLLLFVVDASDPAFRAQLTVTREVLDSLGGQDIPEKLVLNKWDQLDEQSRAQLSAEFPEAIPMCARDPQEVAKLRELLIDFFEQEMAEEELFVPYEASRNLGRLRSRFRVLGERHDERGTYLKVRAPQAELARLSSGDL